MLQWLQTFLICYKKHCQTMRLRSPVLPSPITMDASSHALGYPSNFAPLTLSNPSTLPAAGDSRARMMESRNSEALAHSPVLAAFPHSRIFTISGAISHKATRLSQAFRNSQAFGEAPQFVAFRCLVHTRICKRRIHRGCAALIQWVTSCFLLATRLPSRMDTETPVCSAAVCKLCYQHVTNEHHDHQLSRVLISKKKVRK